MTIRRPAMQRWLSFLALAPWAAAAPAQDDPRQSHFLDFALSGGFRSGNGGFQESCFALGKGFSASGTLLDGLLWSGTPYGTDTCAAGYSTGIATGAASSQAVKLKSVLVTGPKGGYSQVDATTRADGTLSGQVRFRKEVEDGQTYGSFFTHLTLEVNGMLDALGPSSGSLPYSVGRMSATATATVTVGNHTETDFISYTFDSLQGGSPPTQDPSSLLFEEGKTGSFLVVAETWLPFRLSLSVQAHASGVGQAAPSLFVGTADFSHTFGLPANVSLFSLPDGYTAEAPGFGVAGNRVASSVPEASSTAMWLIGFATLGVAACRRPSRPGRHQRNG